MNRFIRRGVRAVLPRRLVEELRGRRALLDALAQDHDLLSDVRRAPAQWDAAAVQLHELRSDVRRVGYPQYLYGLLCAARTARAIGVSEFTAIEFGVAGGNGLVALEQYAEIVRRHHGVSVAVAGFDTSSGLPERTDARDCPFAFTGGEFRMDEAALRKRLTRAVLHLGDVALTVKDFAARSFAPIGFVANDLDLYTSTRDSFALWDIDAKRLLPRISMYFDDLSGYPYSTANGEWAAIDEFNATHQDRRLGFVHGLKHTLGGSYRFAHWPELFFTLHVRDHPGYNRPEETSMERLGLRG